MFNYTSPQKTPTMPKGLLIYRLFTSAPPVLCGGLVSSSITMVAKPRMAGTMKASFVAAGRVVDDAGEYHADGLAQGPAACPATVPRDGC